MKQTQAKYLINSVVLFVWYYSGISKVIVVRVLCLKAIWASLSNYAQCLVARRVFRIVCFIHERKPGFD